MSEEKCAEGKCAFAATLMSDTFGCRHARHITRRGGPDIGCDSPAASLRCCHLYQQLKSRVLPLLGYEDNLLTTPHNIMVKIQFGGLLGLQRLLHGTGGDKVGDIDALAEEALAHYAEPGAIPYGELAPDVDQYRVQRGRRRR